MSAAHNYVGMGHYRVDSPLNRIYNESPYLPRCSSNKSAMFVKPRDFAMKQPYMQINRSGMVSWLIFDLDHSNPLIWEHNGLPAPNIVVKDPEKNSSHLFYAIAPVCTTEAARSHPIEYMNAVYRAMAIRLDADPAYSGPVAKTPGHPKWVTWEIHNQEYDLGELSDYIDLPARNPWAKTPDLDSVSHSRHCMLFEELRHYAYSIVNNERENGSYIGFCRLLDSYADERNNFRRLGFSEDLSVSQLKATVKSVARWTWTRYRGCRRCNRGVMGLDSALPLAEKQALSAKRTHKARKSSSEARIKAAIANLQAKGERLTLSAVARIARLTRQTVSKYFNPKEIKTEPATSKGNVIHLKPVKYGAHQMTAPLGASGVRDRSLMPDLTIRELKSHHRELEPLAPTQSEFLFDVKASVIKLLRLLPGKESPD